MPPDVQAFPVVIAGVDDGRPIWRWRGMDRDAGGADDALRTAARDASTIDFAHRVVGLERLRIVEILAVRRPGDLMQVRPATRGHDDALILPIGARHHDGVAHEWIRQHGREEPPVWRPADAGKAIGHQARGAPEGRRNRPHTGDRPHAARPGPAGQPDGAPVGGDIDAADDGAVRHRNVAVARQVGGNTAVQELHPQLRPALRDADVGDPLAVGRQRRRNRLGRRGNHREGVDRLVGSRWRNPHPQPGGERRASGERRQRGDGQHPFDAAAGPRWRLASSSRRARR